jgi:hypothetical protein
MAGLFSPSRLTVTPVWSGIMRHGSTTVLPAGNRRVRYSSWAVAMK